MTRSDPGGDGTVSAYVTPLVQKLAAEQGVDLTTLRGTGVGGRIRRGDVLGARHAEQPGQAIAPAAATPPPCPRTTKMGMPASFTVRMLGT